MTYKIPKYVADGIIIALSCDEQPSPAFETKYFLLLTSASIFTLLRLSQLTSRPVTRLINYFILL